MMFHDYFLKCSPGQWCPTSPFWNKGTYLGRVLHTQTTLLNTVRALSLIKNFVFIYLSIYIPWPFPPVWGVADNTKETTKTMGISLRSSSNDEGPSRAWMALLEQHSPSSPVFHNLLLFIHAISPTAPTSGGDDIYEAT